MSATSSETPQTTATAHQGSEVPQAAAGHPEEHEAGSEPQHGSHASGGHRRPPDEARGVLILAARITGAAAPQQRGGLEQRRGQGHAVPWDGHEAAQGTLEERPAATSGEAGALTG
eukprot:CAMPEP_0183453040 /NCGR_PEP_ID=MMETSP0370-20130417/119840_1 /TAXON_ID=268820 /ORGANISM="Peridinium aciculiferum, Strain PAER-2" /LENGTH=115 /DNA_ID=CAMNT_0025644395 /DNA_START=165 /DNA_END=509 /DNA_ORIENTATION=+